MAGAGGVANGGNAHDLKSLLSGEGRDFLVRNNGDQVKISKLDGKVTGLYFSASWCGPCRRFTPKLVEAYNEISSRLGDFEVVFVPFDIDEDSFNNYFSEMPWLAIPFSDSETRSHLDGVFGVRGIPHLVIIDKSGKVLTNKAVQLVRDYGSEGYPFTPERIEKMKEEEKAAKNNQTLRSVLVSSSRDFVISKSGNKVPVTELEGKIVALYFSVSFWEPCNEFSRVLADVYGKLKEKGESFEVVLVCFDDDESSFEESFASMPWLAIPVKDKSCEKLARYFELETIPKLVVIGSDGKTMNLNAAELVEEYGVEAYPFSPEKLEQLEKARREAQTLESLLVSGERDYVIGKGNVKVPISELVGKTILLYFSAEWYPPCGEFLPMLIEAYHKIKEKDNAFEVIFVSSDEDQSSFDDSFSGLPWLALPFGDEREKSLSRTFKIRDIPSLVAIGPTGKTITKEARELVLDYGADAYPFTEERMKKLEAETEEMAKGWPKKVKHELHEEHELVKTRRRPYVCDRCGEEGKGWSYHCEQCDFDLHLKCALEEDKKMDDVDEDPQGRDRQGEAGKEGYASEEGICYEVLFLFLFLFFFYYFSCYKA